jgi:hypothetical protein
MPPRHPSLIICEIMAFRTQWDCSVEGRKMIRTLKEAEGGALGSVDMAKHLGVTAKTLQIWTTKGQVVAWRDGAKRFRYPVWQLCKVGLMPGVRECLAELVGSGSDQWSVMRFFLAPSEQLGGRTPLALLRDGEIAGAVALARSVAGD